MTVLTFSEDPVAAAKVAEDFAKENKKFEILGGAMGENALDRAGVEAVSKMPSREELIASIAGCIGAPASTSQGPLAHLLRISPHLVDIEDKASCLSNLRSAWEMPLTLEHNLETERVKMADLKKLAEEIVGLTLLEAQELKTILKDEYGIEPAAGGAVMMAGPARRGGGC